MAETCDESTLAEIELLVYGRSIEQELADELSKVLHDFVEAAWPIVEPDHEFVDGPHIVAICDHLQALTLADSEAEVKNLLINIPPGCMKSLICCVFWPCWVWTFAPEKRFWFSSYGIDLAMRDSVKCRDIIESEWYQTLWPHVTLKDDDNQKKKFSNTAGGWRFSTSIGGRGTGEHPDFIVVDDPHTAIEAKSSKERQKAIDAWDGTIGSRGKSRDVRKVVIMQRLDKKDLSAHIIAKGLDRWDWICLPMEYEPDRNIPPTSLGFTDWRTEPNELLFPKLFSRRIVDELKIDLGSRNAPGQLQQRPVAAGGGMFKRSSFKVAAVMPAGGKAVRYWDKAGTDNDGDYTSGGLIVEVERDGAKQWYVDKPERGQWSALERERTILNTSKRDAGRDFEKYEIGVEQEPGSSGKDSAEATARMLAGFVVKLDKVTGSKEVRAEQLASQVEAGNVYLVEGDWNERYLDQLEMFPNGDHDDDVDSSSGAFNQLCGRSQKLGVSDWLKMTRDEVSS